MGMTSKRDIETAIGYLDAANEDIEEARFLFESAGDEATAKALSEIREKVVALSNTAEDKLSSGGRG